ncbi:hypothetical protein SSEA_SKINNY_134 [Mycobacterium phage Skinny]|uniref:Uncharacterized protein n=2 Tax=Bongovirus bongo TaxID=1983750 RepID=A0A514DJA5_9CAUD|nr:hypothetical protein PEGLEG_131 [Mycobacterium phage PegLeg]AGM12359.1 hypothetical protein PEGLEG_131 [Mycobacterium phage PegLeg]QDH93684.1 hypothetical protein SEA_LILHOMIEP_128 [Mycobacterium phage LilhomieP]UXE05348.1 hypothetical protein SSEA_SKINNY_134 [Mycobacterium phage Skinny]
MTDRTRLEQRLAWALHGIRQSWGYGDSARQVLDQLADAFPGEVEAAARISHLEGELRSMEFQRDTARAQLRAHIARAERKAERQ